MEFLKDFFEALYPSYTYSNLKSPLFFVSLDYILIALYVGIVAGLAFMTYRQCHLGRAVRAITEHGAVSEATALDAEALGLKRSRTLTRALKKEKFGSLVSSTANNRYYITEERVPEAEVRYAEKRRGVGFVVIWAIVMIPVFLALRALIPEVLKMLDNFIGAL